MSASEIKFETMTESRVWRVMRGREIHEQHRVSTPLELFFDLIFVVAIAFAGSQLHHAISANHALHGLVSYAMVFFAIWWAWMGFTWFASSFDTDDVPYRIAIFVQMTGALIVAAGIPSAFEQNQFLTVTIGYVVMRIASVTQWFRAAAQSPRFRKTALRYAFGVLLAQLGWLFLLVLPKQYWWWGYIFVVVFELMVPMWAERAGMTSWHPHHISERYGLFTIIVLGESILAATNATQEALAGGLFSANFLLFCLGALLTVFCMWWLYFEDEAAKRLIDYKTAFYWGYGHYFIFAAAAAAGAGLAAQVDYRVGTAQADATVIGYGLAVPVAIYVLFTWLVHKRVSQSKGAWVFPLAALAALVTPWFTGYTTISIGLILVLALGIRATLCGVHARRSNV
ncbi:MAG: low temperature requirement protein A [Burkholderiales bacterium]|nr:low temperature requirement protein A [Burkholderiales bacterium]